MMLWYFGMKYKLAIPTSAIISVAMKKRYTPTRQGFLKPLLHIKIELKSKTTPTLNVEIANTPNVCVLTYVCPPIATNARPTTAMTKFRG